MNIVIAIILIIAIYTLVQLPKFGRIPRGSRLLKISQSPNYQNNSFHNQVPTALMTGKTNNLVRMKEFFFGLNKPIDIIPSIDTDLLNLDPNKNLMVWFGHSSYFIQIDGKKILVDPILSGSVSPIPFLTDAFKGTDHYRPKDIPEIDYLFITHDHWDHLDYETVTKLEPKIKKVICGLGTGEHFEYWGFNPNKLIEMDWNEQIILDTGFLTTAVPARHFSGRSLRRNKTLWASFVLQTPSLKIFLGGDGGYEKHFAEIGKKFGAFDLAILENGQYDQSWKYVHMAPEEVLQAAKDLNAKQLLPIHSAKFCLSFHPWAEPLQRISKLSKNENIKLITPIIGEQVNLNDQNQQFNQWWENVN